MSEMCPHCGYNFAADAPIRLGKWMLTPQLALRGGKDTGLTRTEANVLYAIAKGGGQWVTADAILNRVTDSECRNVVTVMVHRARRKLGKLWPVESGRGRGSHGYRWVK